MKIEDGDRDLDVFTMTDAIVLDIDDGRPLMCLTLGETQELINLLSRAILAVQRGENHE